MDPSLRIRLLREEDLPFADSLRAVAGWNQTPADWRRFLALQPDGCYLAEWDGTATGTATTLIYSPQLAWIGMVLVHPDYRRRGIGQALLQHCVASLREREVQCIKLDATPLGRQIYDNLDFRSQCTLTRWEHPGIHVPSPRTKRLRPWRPSDLPRATDLDVAAFGVSRERLLGALTADCHAARVLDDPDGNLGGYGLLRHGARASYLGPVVARQPSNGLRLAQGLLATCPRQPVFWDIPDPNTLALSWAQRQGFTPQRILTRMSLGHDYAPGIALQQFAIAGPELG